MRGSPDAELAGMLDGLGLSEPLILAVPAFPDAGRITIEGRQRVGGSGDRPEIDVADRVFGSAAVTTIGLRCVESGSHAVHAAISDSLRRAVRNVVVDAIDERHLAVAAQAAALVAHDGVELITVSPGAWLKYHPTEVRARPRFVLVLVSSATDLNRRQLEHLVAATPCLVVDPADAASDRLQPNDAAATTPRVVVLETARAQPPTGSDTRAMSVEAAKSAAAFLASARRAGWRCAGAVVSGGFTAACLVDALGAEGLRAAVEPDTLCGAGRLVGGGWDGMPVITKGGRVGDDSTLARLVASLSDGRADG
jgi:uncharacterized protein YgbK (DUF1537 family)